MNVLQTAWWVFFLRGLLGLALCVLALTTPGATLAALVILTAAYFVADGIASTVKALRLRSLLTSWWVLLLAGIASVAIGIVAFLWPNVTLLALAYLVAFWAILTGVFEISVAIRMRSSMANEVLYVLFGAISIVFGVLAFAIPQIGLTYLVFLIAIYGFMTAVVMFALAFRVRKLQPKTSA